VLGEARARPFAPFPTLRGGIRERRKGKKKGGGEGGGGRALNQNYLLP